MPPRAVALFAAVGLAPFAVGQVDNQLGFDSTSLFPQAERFGANAIAADCLHHFDGRHYHDWLLDPADPTGSTYRFRALRCWIQDQNGSSPQSIALVGYRENSATPDLPDVAAPWFRTGPVTLPPGTGPVAWMVTVTLPTGVPSLPKGDIWLGVHLPLPAPGTWPIDGLSVHTMIDGGGPTIAGLANGQVASYVPVVNGVPTGPVVQVASTGNGRHQLRFEVIANTTGGVCFARRGAFGTTNFLLGLHPDVYNAQGANPPRYDDIGFVVTEANLPNAPAFVAVAFGGNPAGSAPLASLSPLLAAPGTHGNLCIDANQATVFLLTTGANGIVNFLLPLSPAVRTAIGAVTSPTTPFDVWYQGFVLNPNGPGPALEVRATGCGVQHL